MLALDFAKKLKTIEKSDYELIIEGMEKLPQKIREILSNTDPIKQYAKEIKNSQSIFYLGRGLDYKTAIEGSLKLKEVSYIHSEAFAAGELKHGTIALIEKGSPVVVVSSQKNIMDKTLSNVKEVISRGANIFSVSTRESTLGQISHYSYEIPHPILSIVVLQILAYFTSTAKGLDVDKPRNLAKSVTVE